MLRKLILASVLAAAFAVPAATAAAAFQPGPPLTYHRTTCDFGTGFRDVTMWLTAGMGAGATFWLDDGRHYVIQSYRSVDTASADIPDEAAWSPWVSIGKKNGRAGTHIECRGYFQDGSDYYWVDSIDYLVR